MRPDLPELLDIVESDKRLVLVKLFERLDGLDRVRVDDPVPDPVLPLLIRQSLIKL